MVAVITDTLTTSMQPYPRSPYLWRGTHFLINTYRTLTYGELYRIFTSLPLTAFHYISLYSCFCLSPLSFSSLEPFKPPPKDKQNFSRFWEASSHVIFQFQRKFSLLEIAPSFSPSLACSNFTLQSHNVRSTCDYEFQISSHPAIFWELPKSLRRVFLSLRLRKGNLEPIKPHRSLD